MVILMSYFSSYNYEQDKSTYYDCWITLQTALKIAASNLYCKIILVWLDSSLSVVLLSQEEATIVCFTYFINKPIYLCAFKVFSHCVTLLSVEDQCGEFDVKLVTILLNDDGRLEIWSELSAQPAGSYNQSSLLIQYGYKLVFFTNISLNVIVTYILLSRVFCRQCIIKLNYISIH